MRGRKQDGFTLVELMIVVVILALLGVLAVNIYHRYTMKAKTSEAMTMLAHIKAKQEAYHAEHYRYANIPAFWPTNVSIRNKTLFTPVPAEWQQLGINSSQKYVYFQYNVIADSGGANGAWTAPPSGIFNPAPANGTPWFVAQAQARFVDPNANDTTFEITSDRDSVWKIDTFGNRGPP